MAAARGKSYGGSGRAADIDPPTRWATIAAIACCAALLSIFAITSWTAVVGKSAGVDEPSHVVAGWMHLARGDFRVNPQEPPLWKFLATRTNARIELPVDQHGELWSRVLDDASESGSWSQAVLYGTEGGAAVADAVLARSRAVMLAIAVALGAMIGWWAWKIAGPIAAVVAVALFSLDPNFLAHGPLVESDVAMSLALLATLYAVWRVGRRASLARIALLAILAGVTLSLKFSGLFVLVIVCAVVASRVFVPASWPLFQDALRRWWGRYIVAAIVIVAVAGVSVATLWATYAFRFRPAPAATATLNMSGLAAEIAAGEARLKSRGNKLLATQPSDVPSLPVKAALFVDGRQLLPQAWIYGLLDSYQGTLTRAALMLREVRRGGWWLYFPFAMVVKAPLATLGAFGLAVWMLLFTWKRAKSATADSDMWTITCLALPVVLYLFFATLARLDFGIRHVLPVYPLLFIGMGVAAALATQRWRGAKWVGAALLIGLSTEMLRAFPNYVPFFNAAASAWQHGASMLGESNVDLGQDLPLLAKWQAQHPGRKLYVSYFGAAHPALYNINAIDVRSGGIDTHSAWPDDDAVVAVSATHLQGFAIDTESRPFYAELRRREPLTILGGSIYLFELAPSSFDAAQRGAHNE